MIKCVSVENMRLSDAYTIANFASSRELMHRAAYGVFKTASWQGNIAIVVGSGNNGGDGFALACILKEHGFDCAVFTVGYRLSEDSAYYADKARAIGVEIKSFTADCLNDYNIVVDCLLGTGFRGNVRDPYRAAIEVINSSSAYVLSVDINSGMSGDTGESELAVHSDLTVTIGYVKTGLISEAAGKYIKRLVCADIGIVLVKEDGWICGEYEQIPSGCYRSPDWLDMAIIKAYK